MMPPLKSAMLPVPESSVSVSMWNDITDLNDITILNLFQHLFMYIATFDVQDVTVAKSCSEIFVTGVFATNSAAKGLFVVLTSDDGLQDEFRAVLREGQGSGITVPPSTYTVLVYDLEENALPNENVAFIPSKTLTVKDGKILHHYKVVL